MPKIIMILTDIRPKLPHIKLVVQPFWTLADKRTVIRMDSKTAGKAYFPAVSLYCSLLFGTKRS